MTLPGRYDISGYRGDSFSLRITFETETGSPVPMPVTGWSAQVRKDRGPNRSVLASFNVDTAEAAAGELTITLTPEQTAGLKTGVWDIQLTDAGNVRTYLRGNVTFESDVTR